MRIVTGVTDSSPSVRALAVSLEAHRKGAKGVLCFVWLPVACSGEPLRTCAATVQCKSLEAHRKGAKGSLG